MPRSKYTKAKLEAVIPLSQSWAGVIRLLGRKHSGGLQELLRKRADEYGLDYSHFTGQAHQTGKRSRNRNPLSHYLKLNGPKLGTTQLKYKLMQEGFKRWECEHCWLSEWQGQPAPIQLEHKNGNKRDGRLDNLEFLCANCHAQTLTHSQANGSTKPKRPSRDVLGEQLKTHSMRKLATAYGVSDEIIRIWRCQYDLF